MGMTTGGQLVAKMLKKEGVRHIFTLCGLHVAPIYAGCVEEGIQVVDMRHEQAAAHAADAYARMTRGLGVAVVTAGPGVTDALTCVANAYAGDDRWDDAIKWADQSIKVKETFRNLSARANLLWAAGHKQEAFAAADVALAKGKADKADTTNFEKRVAGWKAAKM